MRALVCNLMATLLLWMSCCVFIFAFSYLQFGGGYDILVATLPDMGRFLVFATGFIGSLVLAAIPAGSSVAISRLNGAP